MKLRNPHLIKIVALIAAFFVRLLGATLRYRLLSVGPSLDPRRPLRERFIFAFWHEYIFLPACMGRSPVVALISQHADGELISQTAQHLGLDVVRGSSTRGGIEALRQILRTNGERHLAITPDGPRGPRRELQPGLIYIAARTGLPIVPVGVGFQRAWRARSWDRFAIPRPGAWATCITGQPIRVPENADKEQVEQYRRIVEQALHSITEVAEQWAKNGGQWPKGEAFDAGAAHRGIDPGNEGEKKKQAG